MENCIETGYKYKPKASKSVLSTSAAKRRRRNNFVRYKLNTVLQRVFLFGSSIVYVQRVS